jgi:hypothetical protein
MNPFPTGTYVKGSVVINDIQKLKYFVNGQWLESATNKNNEAGHCSVICCMACFC